MKLSNKDKNTVEELSTEIDSAPLADDNYTPQDLFAEEQLQCCLCGSDLHFQHEMNFLDNKITELSECSFCHVRGVKKEHALH